jgi:hypothetical protein
MSADFDPPFESFHDIKRLETMFVTVTEKIHGSNAQIAISDDGTQLKAGSRNRWLSADHDNYGFYRWVHDNREALLAFLGPGRHYGEWYGAGIGPGYGMKEKRFALFNTTRWEPGTQLPTGVDIVPVLYAGLYSPQVIEETKVKLKTGGSALVLGYMKPEGIVVYFANFRSRMKSVFDKEETGWDKKDQKDRQSRIVDEAFEAEVDALLQPIRLEKLLMKDETYLAGYPATLATLAKDYVADLVKESEDLDEFVLAAAKKKVFVFIKAGVQKLRETGGQS